MELIDLYVKEVGRHLPQKAREDIEKGIRSMIMDALDDRSKAEGRPIDDAMVESVLDRLGPPEEMSASYVPPRYLIGPRLYPHFMNHDQDRARGGVGAGRNWAGDIPGLEGSATGERCERHR